MSGFKRCRAQVDDGLRALARRGGQFEGAVEGADAVADALQPEMAEEVREKYKHPLWKQAGEMAKKMGGHGGMDFLMVLRLAYCLQNGLPLDQNVYDLASWCSLCELTEKSVRNGSNAVRVPDFTCGGWRTTPRLEIGGVDFAKMGFKG